MAAAVLLHPRSTVREGALSVRPGLLFYTKGNTNLIEWLTEILYTYNLEQNAVGTGILSGYVAWQYHRRGLAGDQVASY
jgi:hypothetical protein